MRDLITRTARTLTDLILSLPVRLSAYAWARAQRISAERARARRQRRAHPEGTRGDRP